MNETIPTLMGDIIGGGLPAPLRPFFFRRTVKKDDQERPTKDGQMPVLTGASPVSS